MYFHSVSLIIHFYMSKNMSFVIISLLSRKIQLYWEIRFALKALFEVVQYLV